MAKTKSNGRQKSELSFHEVGLSGKATARASQPQRWEDHQFEELVTILGSTALPGREGEDVNTARKALAITPASTGTSSLSLSGRSLRRSDKTETATLLPLERRLSCAPMNPARLFIASLGNPAPHQATRHSAGHVLLKSLQSHLGFPALKKSKTYGGGLVSLGADVGRPEYTLWHSTSFMNVSGTALLKAYKHFVSAGPSGPQSVLPSLIILHDEMESASGQLKVRQGQTSNKGHNGLKSVQQSLQTAGLWSRLTEAESGGRFIKIGVGIGRPAGGTRDRDAVSAYVLGQLTSGELTNVEGSVRAVVEILESEKLRVEGDEA